MRHALLLLALAVPAAASAQVVVSVSTDRTVYAPADTIRVAVTATNTGAEPVTLRFGSLTQSDFELNGLGTSCVSLTMVSERTIGPGARYTWGWPNDSPQSNGGVGCLEYAPGHRRYPALRPGTYTVRGFVVGAAPGGPLNRDAATTITVTSGPLAGAADPDVAGYSLQLAGPNPVRGMAAFVLRAPEAVMLDVHDMLGRVVQTTRVAASAGETRVSLDVRALPAGAYVVRVAGRPGAWARFVVAR